ncbi:HNH endonuclease [Gordonia phage MagicMan]|nr:HNH endonuclease [Gordonia phage MagicMan]
MCPLPFFQVDDQLPANRKVRQLVETALEGQIEGMAAGFLWTLAGAQCQLVGTDGVVSRADLVRLVLNPDLADRLAGLLVDTGLWHRPGHDCDRCPPVEGGHYLFHDWFAMRYTPANQVRVNRVKRQELKDPELIAQVWARDCLDPADPSVGGCRYCRATVKRKDTRSEKRPHLDHVDPRKAAGIRNVVLACHECNQRKGNRTPQEAGMTLLPPRRPSMPDASEDTARGGPVAETGDAAGPTGSGSSRPADPAAPPATSGAATPTVPTSPVQSGRPAGRPSNAGDAAGPTGSGTPRPADPAAPAHLDGRPPADQPPDHSETSLVPPGNQEVRAVPRGRGPGQGQGQGVGRGVGKGELSGLPQPTIEPSPAAPRKSRRRKRPRSRSRAQPPPGDLSLASESLDAGPPPPGVQAPAGGFGSPWHGWRGPPSPVTETDCPTHHLPEPCTKCARDSEGQ